jgi:signal peptidase II
MLDKLKNVSLPLLLVLIAVVIGLDQYTKWLASTQLQYANPVEILPVLNWMLLHNHGAAFSFLSDAGGWQRWLFTAISSGVSIAFMVWLVRMPKSAWLMRYSLTFVIAGAIGNLIDRMVFGYVIDFISVHWDQHYFPAFNLADSAITFGAFLMILDMFINPEKKA